MLTSLAFLLSMIINAHAGYVTPELRATLMTLGPDRDIPVIITLTDTVDLTSFTDSDKGLRRSKIIKALQEKSDTAQRPLTAFLRNRGISRYVSLWIINGLSATVPADMINAIANFPGVESVALDYSIQAPAVTYGTTASPQWNIVTVKAPDLWNLGYDGTGVVVAGMDTGVDINHPDLQSRWRGGADSWYDPNGQHAAPYDASGHGTQTMGIMVGGNAGGTSIGIAPAAKWIAVKIFNDQGAASLSVIHQGFQWLLDPDHNPDTDDAPDVVNNSWGLDSVNGCSSEFQADIQALKASNIAVVFADGNYGPYPSTSISPANNTISYATGATDSLNNIAYFSSRGPSVCDGSIYPEIVAPGVNVRTADLTEGGMSPNSYATVSGTSFAAPHVSGIMALLIDAFPGIPVQDLELALGISATDLGTPGADNSYGYGLVNGLSAYNYLFTTIPMNDPPVALNDNARTSRNKPVTINVVANDYDVDGTVVASSIAIISMPAKGIVINNYNGTVKYTPNKNFKGTDSFTYTVRDDNGAVSNVATVKVTVK